MATGAGLSIGLHGAARHAARMRRRSALHTAPCDALRLEDSILSQWEQQDDERGGHGGTGRPGGSSARVGGSREPPEPEISDRPKV